jgi:flagellar basal body-associated protein FliL
MKRRRKRRRKKAPDKTMDLILLLMAVFLVAFIIAMIVVFVVVGSEPSTLIACVFTACTAEGGFMAMIKSTKVKTNSGPTQPDPQQTPSAPEPQPPADDGAGKG